MSSMYGYIYLTTNLINDKKYIGKHTSEVFDPSYKGSGYLLKKAFNKYGYENFSVELLCRCFSEEELNAEEILIIDLYEAVESPNYYNLQKGGSGNRRGSKLSEEAKRKISEHHADISGLNHPLYGKSKSGSRNPMYGRRHTEEAKLRISEFRKSFRYSEDQKKKLSESKIRDKNPFYGKKHTEETRLKMSRNHADISGEKNPCYGKKCYNNGIKNKFISIEEIPYYESIGYSKGKLER